MMSDEIFGTDSFSESDRKYSTVKVNSEFYVYVFR
jgi:hypothetical protein